MSHHRVVAVGARRSTQWRTGGGVHMTLHARLYAAHAARSLQEQERLAEELRAEDREEPVPKPAIPQPRRPTPPDRDGT